MSDQEPSTRQLPLDGEPLTEAAVRILSIPSAAEKASLTHETARKWRDQNLHCRIEGPSTHAAPDRPARDDAVSRSSLTVLLLQRISMIEPATKPATMLCCMLALECHGAQVLSVAVARIRVLGTEKGVLHTMSSTWSTRTRSQALVSQRWRTGATVLCWHAHCNVWHAGEIGGAPQDEEPRQGEHAPKQATAGPQPRSH